MFLRLMFRARRAFLSVGAAAGVFGLAVTSRANEGKVQGVGREMQELFSDYDVGSHNVKGLHKLTKKGKMTKEQFVHAFNELGVTDAGVIESFFEAYDTNHDGAVSFEEFAAGVAVVTNVNADPEDKLRFIFEACDIKGNGVVEKHELQRMIHALMVTHERLVLRGEENITASPISSHNWKSNEEYLRRAYKEFPDMKNLSVEECLNSMSSELSDHIFNEVKKRNNVMNFNQFQSWAAAGSKDAKFLMSLFNDFEIEHAKHFTETEEYLQHFDNVPTLDGCSL